ncbi:MAG: hypothetical protein AAF772_09440, partial [Acidobacteriota bacterium]
MSTDRPRITAVPAPHKSACPDWHDLVAREAERTDPAAWDAAIAHLMTEDGPCPDCYPTAIDAEPTLMFRTLPASDAAEASADTIADMKQAVAALRRTAAVDHASDPPPRRRVRSLLAAAVGLALGGWLLLAGGHAPDAPTASEPSTAARVAATADD